jgi:hypothetical protein
MTDLDIIRVGADYGVDAQHYIFSACVARGFRHFINGNWSYTGDLPNGLEVFASTDSRSTDHAKSYVYGVNLEDALARVVLSGGRCTVSVAGLTPESAAAGYRVPTSTLAPEAEDTSKVPVTFWTWAGHGPEDKDRLLDYTAWNAARGNYAEGTDAELGC